MHHHTLLLTQQKHPACSTDSNGVSVAQRDTHSLSQERMMTSIFTAEGRAIKKSEVIMRPCLSIIGHSWSILGSIFGAVQHSKIGRFLSTISLPTVSWEMKTFI